MDGHLDEHAKQYDAVNRADHSIELKQHNESAVREFLRTTDTHRVGNRVKGARLQVIRGDITTVVVDAIVNAANEVLEGGGGVDQAIHKAAGPGLAEECKRIPKDRHGVRCYTGEAKITGSHNIRTCKHIIHTVGPYLDEKGQTQPVKLASCYRNCLELCLQNGLHSVAFPCISTGYYGYPMVDGAQLAVQTVSEWLEANNDRAQIETVTFVVFNSMEEQVYQNLLA
jgi:O-acetyl-ADP-ribose deacetylase (regulator of RNase III)